MSSSHLPCWTSEFCYFNQSFVPSSIRRLAFMVLQMFLSSAFLLSCSYLLSPLHLLMSSSHIMRCLPTPRFPSILPSKTLVISLALDYFQPATYRAHFHRAVKQENLQRTGKLCLAKTGYQPKCHVKYMVPDWFPANFA